MPGLWRSELRNVLARYLRARIIGLDQARALIRSAEAELTDCEHEVDSVAVMNLVAASSCSAFDCEFVVLVSGRSFSETIVGDSARNG